MGDDDMMVKQYIDSLTPLEIQALEIAKDHLKSSFDIYKSIGFIEWRASYTQKN